MRVLGFSGGPGRFREVWEAGRNHFHLSWYLIVPLENPVQKIGILKGGGDSGSPPSPAFKI